MIDDKRILPPEENCQTLEQVYEKLRQAYAEIQSKNAELEEAYQKLGQLARTDILTGLPNRLELDEQMQHEVHRFERNEQEFSICLADIDDFKQINDNYGHDVGDIVLKDVAKIFRESSRSSDIIGRWGGEEFLFILPDTPVHGALDFMERVRTAVMGHEVRAAQYNFKVTITLGCSSFTGSNTLEEVIKQADQALYAGKKTGKNLAIKFTNALENIHSIHT